MLLSFAAAAFAVHVAVVDPVSKTIEAGEALLPDKAIDLGLVGPGQKLEIIVDRDMGEISQANATVSQREALWDNLRVEKESLPKGWQGQDGLKYDKPLKAFVVVAKDASDGGYSFLLQASSDYEPFAPITFKAGATVSKDVLAARVAGEPVKAAPRTQVVYQLELENKGSASDAFQVSINGLPGGLQAGKNVFVPHNAKVTVDFPVTAPEAGEYRVGFTATSLSSKGISASAGTTLFVGSSLLTDAKAAARGVLLFPSAEQLAYAFLGLVGSLLH